MLYELFKYLENDLGLPGAGLFQFLSFRASFALILALFFSIIIGNVIIRKLQKMQIGESIRELGLAGQNQKAGTPTMGGLIVILAIVIPCLLIANLSNIYIILMLITTIWLGLIGFADDYIKVFKKDKSGLQGKFKVFGQVGLGIIIGSTMLMHDEVVVRMPLFDAMTGGYEIVDQFQVEEALPGGVTIKKEVAYVKSTLTNVPFFKGNVLDYKDFFWFLKENAQKWVWLVFITMVIFVVTSVSNGANLTDGLDGLLAGTSAIIAVPLLIFSYVSGNSLLADYLNILYIPLSGELVVFAACLIGACIGFLWFNAFPAKVFMGDTGSLALGGIIASMAILLRKELLIPLLCGIFLVETLSVILQVGYFKYTKRKYGEGQRIFLMSPIHHHYQKKGMHEVKIVTRFWIVCLFLAVLSIITLKMR